MCRGGGKRRQRKDNAPSDADLDKTYTGLDRELAEEFIEQTMEGAPQQAHPHHHGGTHQRQSHRPKRASQANPPDGSGNAW